VVAYPRTALGTGDVRSLTTLSGVQRPHADLRPLNAPTPLKVQLDTAGRVVSVWRHGRLTPRAIAAVQDRWRIDDEWWREHPIARLYYEVILDDGTWLTIYHDLIEDRWFEQRG
jgi:hypothetical protein